MPRALLVRRRPVVRFAPYTTTIPASSSAHETASSTPSSPVTATSTSLATENTGGGAGADIDTETSQTATTNTCFASALQFIPGSQSPEQKPASLNLPIRDRKRSQHRQSTQTQRETARRGTNVEKILQAVATVTAIKTTTASAEASAEVEMKMEMEMETETETEMDIEVTEVTRIVAATTISQSDT